MKKKISLNKFVFFQSLIMIIILFLYLIYVVPQIKPMCKKSSPCASAYNCSCKNKKCTCDYLDESENRIQIECEQESNN